MNPDLEHLIVLQAQDLELARLRRELAEIPTRLKAVKVALDAAEGKFATGRDRLLAEEKLRRGQESEIATHRAKLQRLRRSLDTATSAQQVAAFQHEIDFAEAAIARLEEEAFSSLERTETLDADQATATEAVTQATAALARIVEQTTTLKVQSEATIAGIERQRSALRSQIADPWLTTYDRLARTRGTAVAEALGNATAGKCAACQMSVRPQRWQDLTGRDHEDEIFACESCGRLLFWDPRRDTPRNWSAGDRLASTGGSR